METSNWTAGNTLITGAAGGIGWQVADRLLRTDANSRCMVIDRSIDALEGLQDTYGRDRVFISACDVSNREDVVDTVKMASTWCGGITGLVNCAGNQLSMPSINMTAEQWHSVLDVHLDGSLFASQAVAHDMIRAGRGAIVNVASVAMYFGFKGRLPYGVAKAGIGAMTRGLAVEWAEHGIRVNAVAPGYVNSSMVEAAMSRGDIDETVIDAHALGRFAETEEIATVIEFLLGPGSSFMTGEVVNVDGGFSIYKLLTR
jgi:NAD(P)-dependent dehydrogenase (short-subunit alcohol dehydrogenase family)